MTMEKGWAAYNKRFGASGGVTPQTISWEK